MITQKSNIYETFVADSETPVSIIPVKIAKNKGIKWYELDPDEPNYSRITENQLSILCQTTITVKFSTIKRAQTVSALVCREEDEESLIDLDTLKSMGVIHDDFPLPMDPARREDPEKIRLVNTQINRRDPTHLVDILERQGSMRTSMKFHDRH